MDALRNELDPSDQTDHSAKPPMAVVVVALAGLHLLCCGLPLLLLSGLSLTAIVPRFPVIGAILAVLGLVGFVWYLKRGCATCPGNPKRCRSEKDRRRQCVSKELMPASAGVELAQGDADDA